MKESTNTNFTVGIIGDKESGKTSIYKALVGGIEAQYFSRINYNRDCNTRN